MRCYCSTGSKRWGGGLYSGDCLCGGENRSGGNFVVVICRDRGSCERKGGGREAGEGKGCGGK